MSLQPLEYGESVDLDTGTTVRRGREDDLFTLTNETGRIVLEGTEISHVNDLADEPAPGSKADAIRTLDEMIGQRYYHPEYAQDTLQPFASDATPAILDEYGVTDYPGLIFGEILAERVTLATDSRGIVNVQPYKPIITGAKVSEILVESIGGEPSEHTAGGAGFTADGRHDQNVPMAAEILGLEDALEGEDSE